LSAVAVTVVVALVAVTVVVALVAVTVVVTLVAMTVVAQAQMILTLDCPIVSHCLGFRYMEMRHFEVLGCQVQRLKVDCQVH